MPSRTWTFRMLLAAAALLVFAAACDDEPKPDVDVEIRIETARFFPSAVTVGPGSRVRWVNVLRREEGNVRTVTSGTGPDDPDAGMMFDAPLQGYASGEAEGENFTFRFDSFGTFHYFTRLPNGQEYGGTVTVQ